jgi:hypothetical protein
MSCPSTDQSAGRIVLGSFMFARGKGLDHWTEMLSKQKEQIQYWHAVSEWKFGEKRREAGSKKEFHLTPAPNPNVPQPSLLLLPSFYFYALLSFQL